MRYSQANKASIYLFIGLALICIAAWWLQASILFSWDNDILLHETQRMLNGGSYSKNFFETSPPMILFLYVPPLLFAKAFSLSLFLVFRCYIFLLAFLSLGICRTLLAQIFLEKDYFLANLFFLFMAATFLILPEVELGQREHLFVLFCMPYIFSVVLRLEGKALSTGKAVSIGLLAGLGFAIKPYFILTPLLLELFVVAHKRSLLACFRPETWAIAMVLLIYLVVALTLQRDYFQIIVPYAMRLYYSGHLSTWQNILFHPLTGFIAATGLFFFIQYNKLGRYKLFASVLFNVFISFFLIYILQRHLFYYHVVPVLTQVFLLQIFLFYSLTRGPVNTTRIALLAILTCVYIILAFFYMKIAVSIFYFTPQVWWSFIAVFFLLLSILLKAHKNLLTSLLSVAVIIGLGYAYDFFALRTIDPITFLGKNIFIECVILSIMLFTLLAKPAVFGKTKVFILTTFFVFTFFYPCCVCKTVYMKAESYKIETAPLIAYMKANMRNRTVYLFSSGSRFVFPLIDYAGVTSVSRFPFFWMMPGLIRKNFLGLTDGAYQGYIKDRDFLIDMVTEDLNEQKPDFVLVDVGNLKTQVVEKFDYLPYFNVNAKFQDAWKHYRYTTTIKGDPIFGPTTYDIAIYERVRSPNNL